MCTHGRVDFPCSTDADCGLPARAYDIQLARRKNREAFFQALRAEIIDFGTCPP
jgi:hypothetical protein